MLTNQTNRSFCFLALGAALLLAGAGLDAQSPEAALSGIVRDPSRMPIVGAAITATLINDHGTTKTAVSGADGSYLIPAVPPGMYSIMAQKTGYTDFNISTVQVMPGLTATTEMTMLAVSPPSTANAVSSSFTKRFLKAYWDDWHPSPTAASSPAPAFRGYPAPESTPPYPFTVWPIGGTVNIGQPFSFSTPLMTAIYGGKNGEWWQKSKIGIYGWANAGMNFSTSNALPYGNAPAAYPQIPNSIQLDQLALYIERQPDTVQTDHFDWGFRLTNLYGFDYRFTTAKGIFSQQLLNNPKPDGSIGNKYGYDPVMFYIDLYFPHVAQGMDVRIGRYISLPDIEAQLAPNNYTYTHSLTYSYDCYTQQGINTTTKLSNHWTLQLGLSAGCEAAPFTRDAKLTGNVCVGYTWRDGQDNIYTCANSLNDSKYAYNNLAAYYVTFYHKFNKNWHTATEAWYQYVEHTPNVTNPAAASLLQTNANGAVCNNAVELTCFAPSYAAVNYTSRQLGPHDFITFRNEYFDDLKGQRTAFKTRYVEDGIGWNHWIGTTVLLRPELRYEHAFDAHAYDNGQKKSQFMFAGDVIWFY
jgi:hypothetical protein